MKMINLLSLLNTMTVRQPSDIECRNLPQQVKFANLVIPHNYYTKQNNDNGHICHLALKGVMIIICTLFVLNFKSLSLFSF